MTFIGNKTSFIRIAFALQHTEPLFEDAYETEEETFNRICPVSIHSWNKYWSCFLFNLIHIQIRY